NQMRGGFSKEINHLREALVHFVTLIELVLELSEEDVEFASREDLSRLVDDIQHASDSLIKLFDQGNVDCNGVLSVIAGKANDGKSTLLNAILNEERAIVSEIPGTTRDIIEDEVVMGGINFRFIDTAGLRETVDVIEAMGVERTRDQMKKAALILYLFDLSDTTLKQIEEEEAELKSLGIPYIKIGNKLDKAKPELIKALKDKDFVFISASNRTHLDQLKERILSRYHLDVTPGDVVVTNLRHYQNLVKTHEALDRVVDGIENGVTGDLLALDIRDALHYLGEITGKVTTEDLLDNIFSKFCVGK